MPKLLAEWITPRVLSRNEIVEIAGFEYPIVFVEAREIDLDEDYPIWFEGYAEPVNSDDETCIYLYGFGNDVPIEAKWKNYGKSWRCWSRKPMQGQCRATPWIDEVTEEGKENETEN